MKPSRGKCPRCGGEWDRNRAQDGLYPALSRRDNDTDICSLCGVAEALEDAALADRYIGPVYWKENK